jgi:hypothetical protein
MTEIPAITVVLGESALGPEGKPGYVLVRKQEHKAEMLRSVAYLSMFDFWFLTGI